MPKPGHIRIIGGRLRGSRLAVPISPGLRPTPNRVRETLFNWLASMIHGARCLDLFAGSGANGIEALSRGAGSAIFVERTPRLAEHLRDNLSRLKVEHAEVVCTDALDFLRHPATRQDIVFMDPPFALDLAPVAALALEKGNWLNPGAMIYVELPQGTQARLPENWRLHRHGHAGALSYSLYQRIGESGSAAS